jgi:hypothetical protein
VDLQMPSHLGEPLREDDNIVNSRPGRQVPHVVKTRATQACGIEAPEFVI